MYLCCPTLLPLATDLIPHHAGTTVQQFKFAPAARPCCNAAVIMTDLRDLLRREAPGWAHRTEGWGIGRTSHHCSWEGVTCKAGHVTQL